MKIIHGYLGNIDRLQSDWSVIFKKGVVATIGNFDGVHLGHQMLIKRTIEIAKERKKLSAIIIFEPHPDEFFKKGNSQPRLTSFREKISQLKKYPLDYVIVLSFNSKLSKMSAEEFAETILKKVLNTDYLIIGDDFHCGYDRAKNGAGLSRHIDFIEQQETQKLNGLRISSSRIRESLMNGNLDEAKELLGRDYSVCGKVVHGDKRGRIIEFPTANISLKKRKLPLKGVFAVNVIFKENIYKGIANIGTRPSIKAHDNIHLEVHILDFKQEIYGEHLEIVFLKKIRDEKKFISLEALKKQIEDDKIQGTGTFWCLSPKIRVSAPGSIMLLGEHAVLRGYPTVSCAVNRRIMVELISREDNQVEIDSDIMGKLVFSLREIPENQNFRFVLRAISLFQERLKNGFYLKIQSEFSDKIGLGSSAAVTVAVVAALEKFITAFDKISPAIQQNIFKKSVEVIRSVQGVGSGADVGASVFGGVIHYQNEECKKLNADLPICLIYTGYKTPTVEVIAKVNQNEKQNKEKFNAIFSQMGALVEEGVDAIQKNDLKQLGEIFYQHQQLQELLGVSDSRIDEIIRMLKKMPAVYGAKISGSGLGDCVVALGDFSKVNFSEFEKKGYSLIRVSVESEGLK